MSNSSKMPLKQFIIILVFVPFITCGQNSTSNLSFYWGTSYRINDNFYNSFDLTYEYYYHSCLRSFYNGLSIRYDNFGERNNSFSIRYFNSLVRRPHIIAIPFWAVSPVVFTMTKHIGLNVKPEIGIRFNSGIYSRLQPVSLSFLISYGYDIPIIEESSFIPGRHDFNAKIALTFNLSNLKNRFKRSIQSD
jgi:hypothetical protein